MQSSSFLIRSPIVKICFTPISESIIALKTSCSPASISLAISTSPSLLKRVTKPISRRYILTGSATVPKSTVDLLLSLVVTFFTVFFLLPDTFPFFLSIISIWSPSNIMSVSSIFSEESILSGNASLISS